MNMLIFECFVVCLCLLNVLWRHVKLSVCFAVVCVQCDNLPPRQCPVCRTFEQALTRAFMSVVIKDLRPSVLHFVACLAASLVRHYTIVTVAQQCGERRHISLCYLVFLSHSHLGLNRLSTSVSFGWMLHLFLSPLSFCVILSRLLPFLFSSFCMLLIGVGFLSPPLPPGLFLLQCYLLGNQPNTAMFHCEENGFDQHHSLLRGLRGKLAV